MIDAIGDTLCPEIPRVLRDAVVNYAAFLALSKEGKKTQDLEKAAVYLKRYEQALAKAASFTSDEVDVAAEVSMPWRT